MTHQEHHLDIERYVHVEIVKARATHSVLDCARLTKELAARYGVLNRDDIRDLIIREASGANVPVRWS